MNQPLRPLLPLLLPPAKPVEELDESAYEEYQVIDRPQMSPCRLVERAIREGSMLEQDPSGPWLVLKSPEGTVQARGARIDEIGVALAAAGGVIGKRPWIFLRLTPGILRAFDQVKSQGEALSAFVKDAMQHEIAARLASDT